MSQKLAFNKYVKVRQEKFGAVVFDTLREKVFVTNQTGGEILKLLEKGMGVENIIKELEAGYAGDTLTGGKIKDDIDAFLDSLIQNRILTKK